MNETSTHGQVTPLPRYERPHEELFTDLPLEGTECIPSARAGDSIAASGLSEGSKQLLTGLLRLGCTKVFPGGGVGIEYGSLLKTAARPEYVAAHVAEASAHLKGQHVDLLLMPGMSGYPVGAMYSVVSGIPAVLLKKTKLHSDSAASYPAGAFVIPSYTGEGEVVISADQDAVQDIVDRVLRPQLRDHANSARPVLTLRAAGADDIIDKATMSQAVGESALVMGRGAIRDFITRHRAATGDQRPIEDRVEVVTWVTPLIKGYNRPQEHLWRKFRIRPFAGITVTSVHVNPQAIGVEGVGVLAFEAKG